MDALKILKKMLVNSQIFVSFMGTLLAVFFLYEQNAFRFPIAILIFVMYFCGYLYTKYQYSKVFSKILIINTIAGIICMVIIIQNYDTKRLYKWGLIVILGFLYNSFFLEEFIRKKALLKVFYVGFIWGLINSWLSFSELNWSIFFISFLFVTALVLPFDIRDMESDNIITFPKIIGIQNTKYLAYLFLFFSSIIASETLNKLFAIAFLLAVVVSFVLVYFSDREKKDEYYSILVESCSGLPFLFLILLKYF